MKQKLILDLSLALMLSLALLLTGLALAIGLGGPKPAVLPLASINEPFKGLDMSDLPPLLTYRAGDGAELAYRAYPAQPSEQGSVVLVHGSSASSASMHRMAKAFQASGLTTYVPDIRGHGASGPKGDIDHIGQLEEDMVALLAAIKPTMPNGPTTLVGFSAGGGFALRFAAGPKAAMFKHYLLLSPFLGAREPTYKQGGGWAQVGVPRILALRLLNTVGITAWNSLPVINYALSPEAKAMLTPSYSYSLLLNFGPPDALKAAMGQLKQPCAILAGADDELFNVDQFEPLVRAAGANWPVRIIPQTSHVTLLLNLEAIAAAVDQVRAWNR